MSAHMYTIRVGNKTVSVSTPQHHYIIGFKNAHVARKVQYGMHPEPQLTLVRDPDIDIPRNQKTPPDIDIKMNNASTLFIPKAPVDLPPQMRDGGFHLHEYKEADFMALPGTKNIGIIIPYLIDDETVSEFVFKSIVIDPISDFYGFRF